MRWKSRLKGGLLVFIGFMLSPLSWWNDAVVNLPLALGFAWLVALAYPPAFDSAVVLGYWLTNVLGLVLMQKGANHAFRPGEAHPYTRKQFSRDLLIASGYTLLIVILLNLNVLHPLSQYWKR
jgi:hypothetical protein